MLRIVVDYVDSAVKLQYTRTRFPLHHLFHLHFCLLHVLLLPSSLLLFPTFFPFKVLMITGTGGVNYRRGAPPKNMAAFSLKVTWLMQAQTLLLLPSTSH